MSSVSRFVDKTRDELRARPVLPFGASVKLGAIGVVEDGQLSPRGNVRSVLGGRVGEVSVGKRAEWELTSGKDVSINFVAKGEASKLFPQAPVADAKVEVSFGSSESFLASVSGLKISTMTNPADLLQKMVEAYERGAWRPEYVLVYEVIVPRAALILLSKTSDSKFLLTTSASLKTAPATAELAGKFRLRFQSKDAVKLDGGGQPLFFNAFRVKENFWTGEIGVEQLSGAQAASQFEQV